MKTLFLLSLFSSDDPLPGSGPMSPEMRYRLILLGSISFVVVALICVVLLSRRKHNHFQRHGRTRRRRSFRRAASEVAELAKMIPEKPRRRRAHRPLNPTLAETGGLPALRSDAPPDPPQTPTQPQ
jgi:hypothetical protein